MTAFQPGSPAYEALIAERDKLRADKTTLLKDAYADNERLRALLNDYSILKRDYDELRADNARLLGVWRDKTTLLKDAYADNERLRALLQKLEWKSIDKDNMEYSCRVPYNVMDEIRRALEQKP